MGISQENYITKKEILDEYRDLLSVDDLSTIFAVSKNTIYKEIKEGAFGKPIRIGRTYKIPKIYIIEKFFLHYV